MDIDDNKPIVKFENIGLRYGLGPEVLQDVTFSLAPGSFHFLVGPSGAGKSSLLKLIYLAMKPSRGLISLFGRDIATTPRRELPSIRRRVGVVFQEFRLLNHLSAFDNVALPLRVAGARKGDIQKHVVELLSWVGLKDHLDARQTAISIYDKRAEFNMIPFGEHEVKGKEETVLVYRLLPKDIRAAIPDQFKQL